MKKNLVLIQPVADFENSNPVLPQDAVGIGMLTIIAYIEKYGYSGEVVHIPLAFAQGYNLNSIIKHIIDADPDVIGIGLNWLHFSSGAMEIARTLQTQFPSKIIVIGGQHATLFAEEIAEKASYITGVTVGESEITYRRLIEFVHSKQNPRGLVDGLCYYDYLGYHYSSPQIIDDLDSIPFYSYKKVWPVANTKCAAVDTVRGTCPKGCPYCIESKTNTLQGRKKFAFHSPQYIAAQIAAFTKEGIPSVTIQDPITLLGEAFLTELCEQILRLGIKLEILNIFVEPRTFSDGFFKLLSMCAEKVVLDYGIESGAESVLTLSDRSFSKKELLENFKLAVRYGIKILTWWMVGMPGETKDTIKDTFEFMRETLAVGALPRWVTPLILFPQTDMAVNAARYNITPYFSSFDDYKNYSKVKANQYGVYEQLVTHSPNGMTSKEIIENTIALKKGIQALLIREVQNLEKCGWDKESVLSIAQEVGGSFY